MIDLFYADETAVRPDQGDFFIYGGVVIRDENAEALHDELAKIQRDLAERLPPLKWNMKGLTRAQQTVQFGGCEEFLRAAASYGVVMNFALISHGIVRPERKRAWQIEKVLGRFTTRWLEDYKEPRAGLVLLDTYGPKEEAEPLRKLLVQWLQEGTWGGRFSLSHIIGIHESCHGSAHFSGLADITINALRMVIDKGTKPETSATFAGLIQPLCPLDPAGDLKLALLEPWEVTSKRQQPLYKELLQRLRSFGLPIRHPLAQ